VPWLPLQTAPGYVAQQQFPVNTDPAGFVQLWKVTAHGLAADRRCYWPGRMAIRGLFVWADGRALATVDASYAADGTQLMQVQESQLLAGADSTPQSRGTIKIPALAQDLRGKSLFFPRDGLLLLSQPWLLLKGSSWRVGQASLGAQFEELLQEPDVRAAGAAWQGSSPVPAFLSTRGDLAVYDPAAGACRPLEAVSIAGALNSNTKGPRFIVAQSFVVWAGPNSWEVRSLKGDKACTIRQLDPSKAHPDASGPSRAEAEAYARGRSREQQSEDAETDMLVMTQQLALDAASEPADAAAFNSELSLVGPDEVALVDCAYNRITLITPAGGAG
jgi:hypothetical protein